MKTVPTRTLLRSQKDFHIRQFTILGLFKELFKKWLKVLKLCRVRNLLLHSSMHVIHDLSDLKSPTPMRPVAQLEHGLDRVLFK